jgi:hypothetical protein
LLGYDVTAVESSAGMLQMLGRRAAAHDVSVRARHPDLRRFGPHVPEAEPRPHALPPNASYELVLAIFTVLNYLVADDDLDALGALAARHLSPGGRMIFDLAERRLFAPALFESERLHREIEVRQIGPDLFTYRDRGCGVADGERFSYDEEFTFRYWRADDVLARLARHGFVPVGEVTNRLRESGSRWFICSLG